MAKVITPKPVSVKMYKTGQTRGADDDVIFQNRVSRSSTLVRLAMSVKFIPPQR